MPGKTKTKSDKSKSKRLSTSTGKKRSKKADPVEETTTPEVTQQQSITQVQEQVPEVVEQTPEETTKKRTRRVVDRDSILTGYDELVQELEREIENIRTADTKSRKTTGVKYLRSIVKRVKTLRSDSARVMKVRKNSNRPRNNKSGFLAPAQISADMSKFTGWDADAPRSRVDVTKYICDYIKQKNLQNPEDRRIIIPDTKLSKLLKIGSDEKDPLTYYSLQKRIQHHFTKLESS